jgi:cell division septation protein DedD
VAKATPTAIDEADDRGAIDPVPRPTKDTDVDDDRPGDVQPPPRDIDESIPPGETPAEPTEGAARAQREDSLPDTAPPPADAAHVAADQDGAANQPNAAPTSDPSSVPANPAAEIVPAAANADPADAASAEAELAALSTIVPAADIAPLDAAFASFLNGLEDLGRQLWQTQRDLGWPFWLMAAALASGACELGRRQLSRRDDAAASAKSDPRRWTLGL